MMQDPIFGAGVRMRGISEGRKPGYFGQAGPGSFTSAAEVLVSRPSLLKAQKPYTTKIDLM